ncbi:hypothetical protein ACFWN1_22280 [Streptomyces sp. NPDC058459]|uniref:hypothetical protein n=1 Tax=Streptomyces sp. NPDC058459 TaxID=3346508 RepID=UPI003669CD3C
MTLFDTGGGEPASQLLGAGFQFTVRHPGAPGNEGYVLRLSTHLHGDDVMQSFPR